jgi:hypothetical protein
MSDEDHNKIDKNKFKVIVGGIPYKDQIDGKTKAALDRRNVGNLPATVEHPTRKSGRNEAGLTPKQEAFAKHVGYEGLTLADAYRKAYSAEGMQDKTIRLEAKRVMDNPLVIKRADYWAKRKDSSVWHNSERIKGFAIEKLYHLVEHAQRDSDKLKAIELLGKHIGMFSEKIQVEDVTVNESPEEIRARIEEILEQTKAG